MSQIGALPLQMALDGPERLEDSQPEQGRWRGRAAAQREEEGQEEKYP